MNPQSQETSPSFNLPSPNTELQAQPAEGIETPPTEAGASKAVEQAVPTTSAPQDDAAMLQMMGPPPMDPTVATAGTSQAGTANPAGMPMIADDTDLIEKEWVEKAKEIVAMTATDPYRQNKEMNKVKVEYLKKRYNKDLKLDE